jgi:tetratricopeptide (TPR) repeat protein
MFVLALLTTMPAPAAAQDDRVEEALVKTDEILARAADVVRESDSSRAREVLELARSVQDNAWSRFRDGRRLQAGTLTREARELGLRALNLAREDAGLRERARREGEKAQRAWEAARESLGDPDGPARQLLEQARLLLEQGRVKFGEQRYEAAVRLFVSSQRLSRQAVGLAEPTDGLPRVLRELERTDALLERVRPLVEESGSDEAERILQHAFDLQRRAKEALRDGHPRAALAGTREARQLANRARLLAHGPVDSASVERALAETDRQIGRASEILADAGDATADALLDRARDHQRRARGLLGEGDLRPALAETRVARSLAKRALRIAEDGGDA